jgi:hypothetical protein
VVLTCRTRSAVQTVLGAANIFSLVLGFDREPQEMNEVPLCTARHGQEGSPRSVSSVGWALVRRALCDESTLWCVFTTVTQTTAYSVSSATVARSVNLNMCGVIRRTLTSMAIQHRLSYSPHISDKVIHCREWNHVTVATTLFARVSLAGPTTPTRTTEWARRKPQNDRSTVHDMSRTHLKTIPKAAARISCCSTTACSST